MQQQNSDLDTDNEGRKPARDVALCNRYLVGFLLAILVAVGAVMANSMETKFQVKAKCTAKTGVKSPLEECVGYRIGCATGGVELELCTNYVQKGCLGMERLCDYHEAAVLLNGKDAIVNVVSTVFTVYHDCFELIIKGTNVGWIQSGIILVTGKSNDDLVMIHRLSYGLAAVVALSGVALIVCPVLWVFGVLGSCKWCVNASIHTALTLMEISPSKITAKGVLTYAHRLTSDQSPAVEQKQPRQQQMQERALMQEQAQERKRARDKAVARQQVWQDEVVARQQTPLRTRTPTPLRTRTRTPQRTPLQTPLQEQVQQQVQQQMQEQLQLQVQEQVQEQVRLQVQQQVQEQLQLQVQEQEQVQQQAQKRVQDAKARQKAQQQMQQRAQDAKARQVEIVDRLVQVDNLRHSLQATLGSLKRRGNSSVGPLGENHKRHCARVKPPVVPAARPPPTLASCHADALLALSR